MTKSILKHRSFLLLLFFAFDTVRAAEPVTPDLESLPARRGWVLSPGFKAEPVDLEGRRAVRILSDGNGKGPALARLEGLTFENGEIEVDILGAQNTSAAFIGLAFRVEDERQFDVVYFRPQKFGKPKKPGDLDGEVQYAAEPKFSWDVTRKLAPLKYERNIPRAPKGQDAWFHARIVVEGPVITVFVDGASEPCLVVQESLAGRKSGGLGLWTWSGGTFANLKFTHRNPPAKPRA